MNLKLSTLPGTYSIYRFPPEAALPHFPANSAFFSVTRTKDELSVVCSQELTFNEDIPVSRDWKILKIEGPLDLSMIGIISEVSAILKDAGVPIFIVSTYDTDYILVKEKDLVRSVKALAHASHLTPHTLAADLTL